ncbi:MAG: hypothetical protein L0Z50_04620 [Verrucomicrobiales bacterium]|nr:hypothetical protein [Verrucomicrobiales bacterium]
MGAPTNGPKGPHSGLKCAAAGLTNDYPANASSSFVSPPLEIPDASLNPRLSFWQWFSINSGRDCNQYYDYGQVGVRLPEGKTEWVSVEYIWRSTNDWSRTVLDLRKYGGQTVQLEFYFYSNCDSQYVGWFVDDLEVLTGPISFPNLEGFENGWGEWSAERGNWQIGVPGNPDGPQRAHTGANCAAIGLKGKYDWYNYASLLSPRLTVPEASLNPRLSFWQWFSINGGRDCNQASDYGQVLVRLSDGKSEELSVVFNGTSDWTTALLPLRKYAEQTIQLEFYFYSNCDSQAAGWFIDDVRIQNDILRVPDSFPETAAICEGELLSFQVKPKGSGYRFSLGPGTPEGATIDPEFGVFAWVPNECQGPGVYDITIFVEDSNSTLRPLDSDYITVTVCETNSPPGIDPIRFQTIRAGETLRVPIPAFDLDCPTNTLTCSLDSGPPGMIIDPQKCTIEWTPTPEQATNTWNISLRVSDDGVPPLSTTTAFVAGPDANPPPTPPPPSGLHMNLTLAADGKVVLTVDGAVPGTDYTIQATQALQSPPQAIPWTNLKTVKATTATFTYEDRVLAAGQFRFYRVRTAQTVAERVVELLAQYLKVSPEAVGVISERAVEWPNTSLGCPVPGFAYLQVLVSGSLLTLSSGGRIYEVHTGGEVLLCDPSVPSAIRLGEL